MMFSIAIDAKYVEYIKNFQNFQNRRVRERKRKRETGIDVELWIVNRDHIK